MRFGSSRVELNAALSFTHCGIDSRHRACFSLSAREAREMRVARASQIFSRRICIAQGGIAQERVGNQPLKHAL